MSFFTVDTAKCVKDNICIKVCVANIIKNDPETGFPMIEEKRAARCIACGHCVAFCPHDACSVATLPMDRFVNVDHSLIPAPEGLDMLMRSRRSTRIFRKEPLDKRTIAELANIATAAPSGENVQNVTWAVFTDREGMDRMSAKMAEISMEIYHKAENKRDALVYVALAKAYKSGKDAFLRGAPNMAVALVPKDYEWPEDGTISLTYMELAAHARGIGSCWAGYYVHMARHNQELRELSGIREDQYICGALLLGRPLFKKTYKAPVRAERKIVWV